MSTISESILNTTKKALGIDPDNTDFDIDVIMHINTVMATLNQLGVGPATGFMIEDDTPTWTDLLGDTKQLNSVKTFVYLQVRMYFDPPTTGYLVESMQKQLEELMWRISAYREGVVHPYVPVVVEEVDD